MRFATFLLVGSACAGGKSGETDLVLSDSAGVEIATSPGVDHTLPWTFTEVRRIGGEDSGAASFMKLGSGSVAVDGQGLIHVLDGDAFRVVVFDTTGTLIRSLGRNGGGPGELQFPVAVSTPSGGGTEVLDLGKRGLVRWDGEGNLLPESRIEGDRFPQGGIQYLGDAAVLRLGQDRDQNQGYRIVRETATDTTTLTTLRVPTSGMVDLGCVGLDMEPVFSPSPVVATGAGLIAVTNQTPYVVDLYDGGRLWRSVRREIPPVPPDRDALARLYPEGMKVGFGGAAPPCIIPIEALQEKLGLAQYLPQIRAVALSPDGTLWVERFTFEDEEPRLDVFNPDGGYLGTLEGRGRLLGFVGNLVLFSEEDQETGVQRIVLVRVDTAG